MFISIGACGNRTAKRYSAPFALLPSELNSTAGSVRIDLRVLVDRSIVEAFLLGGRVALTKTLPIPAASALSDTAVQLVSYAQAEARPQQGQVVMVQNATVWSMGCGWDAVPYTDDPARDGVLRPHEVG